MDAIRHIHLHRGRCVTGRRCWKSGVTLEAFCAALTARGLIVTNAEVDGIGVACVSVEPSTGKLKDHLDLALWSLPNGQDVALPDASMLPLDCTGATSQAQFTFEVPQARRN